jgi:hypothetical protein
VRDRSQTIGASSTQLLSRTKKAERTRNQQVRNQMPDRRFPSPWSPEEHSDYFVVRDHNGQELAYIYYETSLRPEVSRKLLTKDEARRIAVNIAIRGKRTLGRSSCRTTWTTRLPCWKSLPLPTRGAHAVPHASQTRATQLARKPLCLRNLDDGARPADRRPGRFLCFQNIDEADAIVFG